MTFRGSDAQAVAGHDASTDGLAALLADAGLESVYVVSGLRLPHSSLETDAVLCGVHPATGEPSYVVVEVKSWTSARADPANPDFFTADQRRRVLNPVEQAERYATYLADHLSILHDQRGCIVGIAYLPNVEDLPEAPDRLFIGGNRAAFRDFLRSRFGPESGKEAADLLLNSKRTAAPTLMSVAADEVGHHSQFVLQDEQHIAYSLVERAVQKALANEAMEVIVVSGGAGTGKSVIALTLLGHLTRNGRYVRHATGSKALTTSLRKTVGSSVPRTKDLFTYFNSFATSAPNELDVLICDEANRIRGTSAHRYTARAERTGRSQAEDLVRAAQVTVFFVDPLQILRPGEVGTVELIASAAEANGRRLRHVNLEGIFRGARYAKWSERLLGLDQDRLGPVAWSGDPEFTVEVTDSPAELEARLAAQVQRGQTARMTAGLCWPISTAHPGAPLPDDVVIGDWRRPWAINGDRGIGGAPPGTRWAIDPAGFGQIGHVHIAQGFEYDWGGVIFGPDLVWRNDRWVAKETGADPALRRASGEAFDVYVRRAYHVLLTRSRFGTLLYSTDAETRHKLRSLVHPGGR